MIIVIRRYTFSMFPDYEAALKYFLEKEYTDQEFMMKVDYIFEIKSELSKKEFCKNLPKKEINTIKCPYCQSDVAINNNELSEHGNCQGSNLELDNIVTNILIDLGKLYDKVDLDLIMEELTKKGVKLPPFIIGK